MLYKLSVFLIITDFKFAKDFEGKTIDLKQ